MNPQDNRMDKGWHELEFTLVSILNSIVNPGDTVLPVGILFKGQVFIIDSKFSQLQDRSQERIVHDLG